MFGRARGMRLSEHARAVAVFTRHERQSEPRFEEERVTPPPPFSLTTTRVSLVARQEDDHRMLTLPTTLGRVLRHVEPPPVIGVLELVCRNIDAFSGHLQGRRPATSSRSVAC